MLFSSTLPSFFHSLLESFSHRHEEARSERVEPKYHRIESAAGMGRDLHVWQMLDEAKKAPVEYAVRDRAGDSVLEWNLIHHARKRAEVIGSFQVMLEEFRGAARSRGFRRAPAFWDTHQDAAVRGVCPGAETPRPFKERMRAIRRMTERPKVNRRTFRCSPRLHVSFCVTT